MRIQTILIENSNRPKVQDQIRKAAIKGAAAAGFNLMIGYDNIIKCGTRETYENYDLAIQAAWERISEDVKL